MSGRPPGCPPGAASRRAPALIRLLKHEGNIVMMLNSIFCRLLFGTGAATVVGLLAAYALVRPARPVSAETATVSTFTHEVPPDVPPVIQVPAGNRLFLKLHA